MRLNGNTMNKTLLLDTFRLIKKTFGRFFLLICIVALGVSFFVGVKSSSPIMAYNVNNYNKKYNLMDYTIYSSYGFDDVDIEELKQLDYINDVEATNFVDATTLINDTNLVIRVHALNPKINKVNVLEGKLPDKANECVIEKNTLYFRDLKIGDYIRLSRPDDKLDDYLKREKFKIVGFISTPYYLNNDLGYSTLENRSLNSYMYVMEDVFDMDYYIELSLTLNRNIDEDTFTDEYKEEAKKIKTELEAFSKTQALHRKDEVLSEAYEKYNDGLKEYEDGLETYNTEIADAEKEISDGRKKIRDGEKEIKDGYAELEEKEIEVEAKLISGAREIEDARNGLGVSHAQYKQATIEFEAKKEELQNIIGQIDSGISQYNDGINQAQAGVDPLKGAIVELESNISNMQVMIDSLDPNDPTDAATIASLQGQIEGLVSQKNMYQAQLDDVLNTISYLNNEKNTLIAQKKEIQDGLASGQSQLDEAGGLIASGFEEITNNSVRLDEARAEAEKEFSDARNDLKKAEKDIAQAKIDLEEGIIELEKARMDGKQELEDAKADLEKAKQDIEELEDGKWTVLDRSQHYASKTFSDTVIQMEAIGNIFPLFFFLVASLVCLTTMTRMVDEQRGQIGIYRALGYDKTKIYFKYVFYAFMATLIGSIVGSIFGTFFFPPIIYNVWGLMYDFPKYTLSVQWDLIILSNIAFVLIMTLTTYFACRKDIKEVPSQLLRPKTPSSGKSIYIDKITFLWDKLNFSTKLTIRNIIRYKQRFFMTVFGIAGCTALLIAGFGIKDSVDVVIDKQFYEIFNFDGMAYIDEDLSYSDAYKIYETILKKEDTKDADFTSGYIGISYNNGREDTVNVEIFDNNEQLEKYFILRKRVGKEPLILSDNGIIINEKLSILQNIDIGDYIEIESDNGVIKKALVEGICENYSNNYVYMSSKYYEKIFNSSIKKNKVLVVSKDEVDISQYQDEIANINGVESISFYNSMIKAFSSMIDGLNSIVYVIVISSGALAFVVLSNLTNVNISEREREIATFKVLGFTEKEVNSFIYKENFVLTILGSIVGIPLGLLLHKYIMSLVEMDSIMFGRSVENISIIIAIGLTLLFSMLVNLFMVKKLRAIKMVESLKSVE